MPPLNFQISPYIDEEGIIRVGCHWGIETKFPIATATCITDDETLEEFLDILRDWIKEDLVKYPNKPE